MSLGSYYTKLLDSINWDNSVEEIVKELIQHRFNQFPISKGDFFQPADFFQITKTISSKHSSAGLSFAMHLYTVWGLYYSLPDKQKLWLEGVVRNDFLFSSLNEPGLYFVNPGQVQADQFTLKVVKTEKGFLLNGVKKFVSLEPFIQYIPMYCYVEGYSGPFHGIVALIADKYSEGVNVVEDWDSISMNHTYSNTISFRNVFVPESSVIAYEEDVLEKTEILGYFYRLAIISVYFGMAERALQHVTASCKAKIVPHTKTKLSQFPGVQFSLSEIIIRREASEAIILNYCNELSMYLKKPEANHRLKTVSLAAKEFVTRSAEEIVHLSMKIEGIQSILPTNILSSMYMDIKAGRFHPPQIDVLSELLAKEHLGVISYKKRWC